MSNIGILRDQIRTCQQCADQLQRPPNPVLQIGSRARILLAGQAPGTLADRSAKPFTDPSGDRLRHWLGLSTDTFYDPGKLAILPMAFCFPGHDAQGGDLPPLKACARLWRTRVLAELPGIELTLLIGRYAQIWHLGRRAGENVTQTVLNWRAYQDRGIIPLPHPSWRNTSWLKRNPWFERDLLPVVRRKVQLLVQ